MSLPPAKLCPKCQSAAPMDAPICRNCAHAFRTQFTPPAASLPPPTHFNHHMATLNEQPVLTAVVISSGILLALAGASFVLHSKTNKSPGEVNAAASRTGLPLSVLHQIRDGMSVEEVDEVVGDKPAAWPAPYGMRLENGGGVYFFWDYTADAKHGFGDPQAKVLTRFEATSRDGAFIYDSWHIHSPADDSVLSETPHAYIP